MGNRTQSVRIFLALLLTLAGAEACGQQPDQSPTAVDISKATAAVAVQPSAIAPSPVGTRPGYSEIPQPIVSVEPPLNTATAAVQATAIAERTATDEAYTASWRTSTAASATALVVQAPTLTAVAVNQYNALHPKPQSPRVELNKAYTFRLYTHCGVDFDTDFDGSFWDAADKSNLPRSLGNPVQRGTMTLVDDSHSRFDYEGGSVPFVRHIGPKVLPGFCM